MSLSVWFMTVTVKRFFERPGTFHPATRCLNPEDGNARLRSLKNLNAHNEYISERLKKN
jgi:hypothetical protein